MSTPKRLTPARLRESLAATRLPENPTDVVMPPGSEQWPGELREALTATLKPAGVLVPVIEHSQEMTVLLTRRSAELKHHASQISFPGGRVDPGDKDAWDAALRETEEEVGLPRRHVRMAGRLDTYVTRTGFEVTPLVGLVRPPFPVTPDSFEVADVFEVPLAFFLDPSSREIHSRQYEGKERFFFAFPFGERYIWGATAGMLVNLVEVLTEEK